MEDFEIKLDEIKELWEKVIHFKTRPDQKKFEYNHVFDENMSVKWNREQVEIKNKEIDTLEEKLKEEYRRLRKIAHDRTIEYIMNNLNDKSEARAEKILSFAMEEKHSYIDDAIEWIDDLIIFVNELG